MQRVCLAVAYVKYVQDIESGLQPKSFLEASNSHKYFVHIISENSWKILKSFQDGVQSYSVLCELWNGENDFMF